MTSASPIVVVAPLDVAHEIPRTELRGILAEVDSRHWGAVMQVLLEGKLQAEQQLRSDQVLSNPALASHYQGWVNYSDYIISSLEALRSGSSE